MSALYDLDLDDAEEAFTTGDLRAQAPIESASGTSYLAFLAVGEGGMARVFLARARGAGGFEKLVVLKTIRRRALVNPSVKRLFAEEARLCAQLNHPNLVQVYDVDLDAELPRLVMEYLEGKSLHEILMAGALPRIMLLTICAEVLSGLHYAHELSELDGRPMGIVHRDISPHNVFVTYDGAAKVLDFGIAKMAGAVSDTATEEVKGKLSYMAPEQLLGTEVDRRADVFAMGVMLWEIAMGRRLWEGVSDPVMMHRLATGDIPRIPEDADVDFQLRVVIHRATAPDPEERYGTAAELQAELDAYIAAQGRRPAMRQIGQTLGVAFQAERKEIQARIHQALRTRETQAPPPPVDPPVGASLNAGQPPSQSGQRRVAVEPPSDPFASERSNKRWLLALVLLVPFLALLWWGLRDTNQAPMTEEQTSSSPSAPSALPPHDGAEVEPPTAQEKAATTASAEGTAPLAPGSDDETGDAKDGDDADENGSETKASSPGKTPAPRPRRIWRPAPTSIPPTGTNAAPTQPSAPARAPGAADCSTPFYYKDGIKTYRPECL